MHTPPDTLFTLIFKTTSTSDWLVVSESHTAKWSDKSSNFIDGSTLNGRQKWGAGFVFSRDGCTIYSRHAATEAINKLFYTELSSLIMAIYGIHLDDWSSISLMTDCKTLVQNISIHKSSDIQPFYLTPTFCYSTLKTHISHLYPWSFQSIKQGVLSSKPKSNHHYLVKWAESLISPNLPSQ